MWFCFFICRWCSKYLYTLPYSKSFAVFLKKCYFLRFLLFLFCYLFLNFTERRPWDDPENFSTPPIRQKCYLLRFPTFLLSYKWAFCPLPFERAMCCFPSRVSRFPPSVLLCGVPENARGVLGCTSRFPSREIPAFTPYTFHPTPTKSLQLAILFA